MRGKNAAPLPLTSGKILLILSVTAISLAGQFTVYPFVASLLKSSFNATPELVAGLLSLYGIAGILGGDEVAVSGSASRFKHATELAILTPRSYLRVRR